MYVSTIKEKIAALRIPYSTKYWQGETLAKSFLDYPSVLIGKKIE